MRRGLKSLTQGLLVPVCIILLLQTAASRVLSIPERDIPVPALHKLPSQIGPWKAAGEQTLEPDVAEYLKPDDYVIRDYLNQPANSSINVFVAHFRSLQDSYGPHSPRLCLPGAGWQPQSSKIATIQVPELAEGLAVNEYILEKSNNRILVVYWYQNNRHAWAEEFQAKLTLLPDLIRYRRSDASLVRLITPIPTGLGDNALANSLQFARLILPSLIERFESAK